MPFASPAILPGRESRVKAKGEKRILKTPPNDPRITWTEWKAKPARFSNDDRPPAHATYSAEADHSVVKEFITSTLRAAFQFCLFPLRRLMSNSTGQATA